jgi:hypothetical protein
MMDRAAQDLLVFGLCAGSIGVALVMLVGCIVYLRILPGINESRRRAEAIQPPSPFGLNYIRAKRL